MSGGGGETVRFPDVAKMELDELIDQLVERAYGVKRAQGRLRALLRAINSVFGDLSLDQVLYRVVEAARTLAGAEYAALGVIGNDQAGLQRFVHTGMDPETISRIAHLPEGKGLLGALITDPRPIRLRHMSDDERSAGFPEGHPEMDSFLGVPVYVRGEAYGNLYLANSDKGEFTAEDESLVIALASAAGSAISNARLYHEAQLRQRWLEASAGVHAQLLSATGEDPLHNIARSAYSIADADLVTVGLLADDRQTFVIESAVGQRSEELVARRFELAGTLTNRVINSGEPFLAVDSSHLETMPIPHRLGIIEAGPVIALPLAGTATPRGVLMLLRRRGRQVFTDIEMSMAATFAQQASLAIELAEARAAEQRMIILEDRERIARDLHDHVIQELFTVGLNLEGAAGQMPEGDPVAERLRERVEDLDRAIRRIRTSIFALRGDLVNSKPALRQAVLDVAASLTPILGFPPNVRFAGLLDIGLSHAITDDAVACVRELLTNVAKHARAASTSVDIERIENVLTITVSDDGIGIPADGRRSGLANLLARAEQHDGTFRVNAREDQGTVATWKVTTA